MLRPPAIRVLALLALQRRVFIDPCGGVVPHPTGPRRRADMGRMGATSDEFLGFIVDGDWRAATRCARRVFERDGVLFLYEEVVQPSLRKVGTLWSEGRISVADEHMATATAQHAVAVLYPLFAWPPPGPRVLVACVQGERHEFGARMVADLLALNGWDDRFLGADVPPEDLARKVGALTPRVVALSITLPNHLPMARAAIGLVRTSAPRAKVLVGGRAAAALDSAAELGADASARSGSQAIEVVRAWK